MSERFTKPNWTVTINVEINPTVPDHVDAGRVAAMFGLEHGWTETLYDQLVLKIGLGQIVAVVGPSGAGKSMLLREVARQVDGVVHMTIGGLARSDAPAVVAVGAGPLAERLEMLSRCGLAEAAALTRPARLLSGGQLYRLALARALYRASSRSRPTLVVADEFAAQLDRLTARTLSSRIRKLVSARPISLVLATPRWELLEALRPDRTIVKPLGSPGKLAADVRWPSRPGRWRIVTGSIADYDALGRFHYLAGRPAAHKRVYTIGSRRDCRFGGPEVAAVLVVSPPLANVRGRNLATGGRYTGPDRAAAMTLLNEEVECISRVVVHPIFRGCGLAVRLVRRALADAGTEMTEALAAMGAVHPFFAKAGMTAYPLGPDRHISRLVSAAEAVGLSRADLAAVGPVKALLKRKRAKAAGFLAGELDLCIARSFSTARLSRLTDPVAEICRRTARQYVYYLAAKDA